MIDNLQRMVLTNVLKQIGCEEEVPMPDDRIVVRIGYSGTLQIDDGEASVLLEPQHVEALRAWLA